MYRVLRVLATEPGNLGHTSTAERNSPESEFKVDSFLKYWRVQSLCETPLIYDPKLIYEPGGEV